MMRSLLLVICVTCHILYLASSLAECLHRDMYSVSQKSSPPRPKKDFLIFSLLVNLCN